MKRNLCLRLRESKLVQTFNHAMTIYIVVILSLILTVNGTTEASVNVENYESVSLSSVACPIEYTITYPDLVCQGEVFSVVVDVVGATTPLDIIINDGSNNYGIGVSVTSFPVSIELGDPELPLSGTYVLSATILDAVGICGSVTKNSASSGDIVIQTGGFGFSVPSGPFCFGQSFEVDMTASPSPSGNPPYNYSFSYEVNSNVVNLSETSFNESYTFTVVPVESGSYSFFAFGVSDGDECFYNGPFNAPFLDVLEMGTFAVSTPLQSTCPEEDFEVVVNVSGGLTPYSVTLFENNINVDFQSGIGSNFTFVISGKSSGEYTYDASVVDQSGCSFTVPFPIITHTVLSSPEINDISPLEFCQKDNNSVQIDLTEFHPALSEGNTIIWSLESNGSLVINNPSNFETSASVTIYAQAEGSSDCLSDILPVQIQLNQSPTSVITTSGYSNIVCPEDSLELTLDNNYDNVQWSTSESSMSIYVNSMGSYSVTVTEGECSGSSSISVEESEFDVDCTVDGTSIIISTTNASLPLNIELSGDMDAFYTSDDEVFNIDNLPLGDYSLEIVDDQGCLLTCDVVVSECVHPDVPNLLTFFNSTNGIGWMNSYGWEEADMDNNCDPCDKANGGQTPWYGIDCDENNDRVIGIRLPDNDLTGSMTLVSDLDSLKYIDLSQNDIRGGNWNFNNPKLQTIAVYDNPRLATTIPVFDLPNLIELYASNDSLFGGVNSFEGIPKIRELFIYDNPLGGEVNLSTMDSLRQISLYNCELSGALPDFNGSEKLISFYGDLNQFTGPLLDYTYLLDLDTLIIRQNDLSGCMPEDVYCEFGWFEVQDNPQLAFNGEYDQLCDEGMMQEGADCLEGVGEFDAQICSCLCDIVFSVSEITIDISESPLTSSMIMAESAICTLYFDSNIQDTILNLECGQVNNTEQVIVYSESGQQVWFDLTVTDLNDICGSTNEMRPFVTTWVTNNPGGSGDSSIRIPTFPAVAYNYNYEVDWDYVMGESFVADTSNITGDFEYNFGKEDTVMIAIRGDFPRIYFNHFIAADSTIDSKKLININQWGELKWSSMKSAFLGCRNLNIDALDSPDLSGVTSLRRMFFKCDSLKGNFENWDTGEVIDMSVMFNDCVVFNSDLSQWDVKNVTNMSGMFSDCLLFNSDLSQWDVSKVEGMSSMFWGCTSFYSDLSQWDVSSVESMGSMFRETKSNDFGLDNWDVSNVKGMSGMFCSSKFNGDISKWNTSNVESMGARYNNLSSRGMFEGATQFNQDIDTKVINEGQSNEYVAWDVSNVKNLSSVLSWALSFDQNLSSWSLNENVALVDTNSASGVGIFETSGISCENYSLTLNGWSNNINTPANREMLGDGMEYNDLGKEGRDALKAIGWEISGDTYEPFCSEIIECNIVSIQNTCASTLDGQIFVDIGSNDICTYSWTNSSGLEISTNINLLGVAPDIYDLYVVCNGDTVCNLQGEVLELELSVAINATNLCDNNQDTIFANTTYATYNWTFEGMEVGTDSELIVNQEGIYTVQVSDSLGCTATATTTVSNFTSPESGILITTFERCNDKNNGETIINLESLTNASGIWSTSSSTIDISDLSAVDFDGVAEGGYDFIFITDTAQDPCTNDSTTITVTVNTCSECGCIQNNPPTWINVDDIPDVTISCNEALPQAFDLAYSNAPESDCLVEGNVMVSIDSSGFNGCDGDIVYRWSYSNCEETIDTSQVITILSPGNLMFDITPDPTILIPCKDIEMYNLQELDYSLDTGLDCIPSGSVSSTRIEDYNECGGTVTYIWNVNFDNEPCSEPITFTQVATIIANDKFQFSELQLPEDITLSCSQLPFEPAILMVSNSIENNCAFSQEIKPVSFPVMQECPGTIVNTWAFINPCTDEQISHAQKVTFVVCAPPVLENDYIEIRAGDINEIDLFENDFNPDSISTRIIEIEREELFSANDYNADGVFGFVIQQSFFDTLRVTYEVCNLECSNCTTATLQIVDEALKDIFLTDIITPDGDGMNDALRFNFEDEISDAHIYIFNRWGSKVYEKVGYTNDWDASGYPGGVYYYVLRIGRAVAKKTLTVVK